MVKYDYILKAIEQHINKTHLTISQKQEILSNLKYNIKDILVEGTLSEEQYEEWKRLNRNGDIGFPPLDEEASWEIEKNIFDHIPPTRIENIKENCKDFKKYNYNEDNEEYDWDEYEQAEAELEELIDEYGEEEAYEIYGAEEVDLEDYFITGPKKMEKNQIEIQEYNGYPENFEDAINNYWTGGYYYEMNQYMLTREHNDNLWDDKIPEQCNIIQKYIKDSEGLQENTILWRGGHWDNLKVGQIGKIPCFNSTSYDKSEAKYLGIKAQGSIKKDPYLIKIYADKGTKGCCVNADSLASHFFNEHEYLLGKGQKYIVLKVDEEKHEATIKLINT